MKKKSKDKQITLRIFSDISSKWHYLILIVISVISRIPFLKNFDLVSFDGTYYILQAEKLFTNYTPHGGYPIGYPFFIACLLPFVQDGVLAAQAISFLSSIGTVILCYLLAKNYLKRDIAFLCSLCLSINPLFIRYSLLSMSESTYIFWLMLSLYAFSKNKYALTGLSIGVSSITRPEGISTFAALAFLRIKKLKQLSTMSICFILIFALNILAYYSATGHLKILPKKHLVGKAPEDWKGYEFTISDTENNQSVDALEKDAKAENMMAQYFPRLLGEGYHLFYQLTPLILIFALYGIIRNPTFLLAGLLQFLLFPVIKVKPWARYILPYIPIMFVYTFIGLESLKSTSIKRLGYIFLTLSLILSPIINRDNLLKPVSDGLVELKQAGLELKKTIKKGEKIADRKPFLAFYAHGEYVELPNNSYDETLQYLIDEKINYMALHVGTIRYFRPLLLPLLYDPQVINGELRFKQIYALKKDINHTVIVYERIKTEDPLHWTRLTDSNEAIVTSPTWSPDGKFIAYGSNKTGNGDIYVIPSTGGAEKLLIGGPHQENLPKWSPDGQRIVYISSINGNPDIYIYDINTKENIQITSHTSADISPSFSRDGETIFFASNRSNKMEIWQKNIITGDLKQLSRDGNNTFPNLSPDGHTIAWIKKNQRTIIYNNATKQEHSMSTPNKVRFFPSWSPDGKFIAITASDWGSTDVYLMKADGSAALLLTKNQGFDGSSEWSPDGDKLALVSEKDGSMNIWIISGIQPFLIRLNNPINYVYIEDATRRSD